MPSSTQRAWSDQNKLALHASSLCRRGHITSSYLTKVALYLLGDGVSSIEDRRSATLKRVALTALKLADYAAKSWRWWPSLSHGREHVCGRLVCREWRGSPVFTPLGSLSIDSRLPFERGWVRSVEPTISIGRWPAGKSPIPKLECRMRKLASTMPKVGCRKRKLKGQMLNVGCKKNECTFHWTWRSNSKTWLVLMKSWTSKAKTWLLHESKLNVECKKVESRVQTQMANTKCRIDCVKYNVKWNIEFWRKWNAILLCKFRWYDVTHHS